MAEAVEGVGEAEDRWRKEEEERQEGKRELGWEKQTWWENHTWGADPFLSLMTWKQRPSTVREEGGRGDGIIRRKNHQNLLIRFMNSFINPWFLRPFTRALLVLYCVPGTV